MFGRAGQLSLLYAPPLLLLLGVYHLGSQQSGVIPFLTRDAAYTVNLSPLLGALSTLGLLLWAATVAICFFTARLVNGQRKTFLQGAGLLTTLLLADDMLQLHEWVFWRYDRWFYLMYGAALLLLIGIFRDLIRGSDFLIIFLAGGFFMTSIAIDVLRYPGDLWVLIEDGAKLLGQCSWLNYFWGVASQGLGFRTDPD